MIAGRGSTPGRRRRRSRCWRSSPTTGSSTSAAERERRYAPFEAGEFTAVLCTASFHHYPDPQRALAEMARVLVPEGRVVLADGTSDVFAARVADRALRLLDRSHVRLYRATELRGLLGDAGFRDVDVERTMGGGWAILSARR